MVILQVSWHESAGVGVQGSGLASFGVIGGGLVVARGSRFVFMLWLLVPLGVLRHHGSWGVGGWWLRQSGLRCLLGLGACAWGMGCWVGRRSGGRGDVGRAVRVEDGGAPGIRPRDRAVDGAVVRARVIAGGHREGGRWGSQGAGRRVTRLVLYTSGHVKVGRWVMLLVESCSCCSGSGGEGGPTRC